MRHAFASNFRKSNFDAAAVANDPFVLNFLVFSASTFPITGRTEDLFAE